MSAEQPSEKPKIIVDDDWKERVQAEKEAARKQQSSTSQESPQPAESAESATQQLPPASFPLLLTSLATQALAALGQIPDPEQKQPMMRLDLAKHHIDTLSILEERTQGNLTRDESTMLSNMLHELRMLYIAIQSQGNSQV